MNTEILTDKQEDQMLKAEDKNELPEESKNKLLYGTHINETDDDIEIVTEVAGYNKDNLEITVENYQLRISSKAPEAKKEEKRKVLQREFSDNGYEKVFRLSEKVDVENISAEAKNGVLSIRLPKHPKAQKRQIEVKAAV